MDTIPPDKIPSSWICLHLYPWSTAAHTHVLMGWQWTTAAHMLFWWCCCEPQLHTCQAYTEQQPPLVCFLSLELSFLIAKLLNAYSSIDRSMSAFIELEVLKFHVKGSVRAFCNLIILKWSIVRGSLQDTQFNLYLHFHWILSKVKVGPSISLLFISLCA